MAECPICLNKMCIGYIQNNLRRQPVALGADLALCQQVRNRCVLHYTGSMDERAVEERYMDIPRFRVKKVDEIKVDDKPKKNN